MKSLSIALTCILLLLHISSAKPVHTVDLKNSRVDVPWKEFREIIDKMSKTVPAAIKDTVYPPVDYCISSARIKGTVVDRKIARFSAQVKIHVSKSRALKRNGWIAVPIGTDNSNMKTYAVYESTELNGKPIPVHSKGGQNRVLISRPGVHTLKINYYSPITSIEGNWKMALSLPHAATAHLDLLIPGSRAEVWVNGIKCNAVLLPKGTRLETAVSLDRELNIRYSLIGDGIDEGSEAVNMAPKVFASTGMLVTIKENRVSYQYRVDYQIWHQKRKKFSIALPDSLPIENVHGAGLSEWKVDQAGKGAVLIARTSFAPDRAYSLTLEFSKKLETVEASIPVPVLRVLNVNRESGCIAIQASETMEVFADDSVHNLTAIPAQELPYWLQVQKEVLMRFKYNRPPYALTLNVLRHKDMPVLVAIADEALFTGLMTRDGYTLVKFRYFIRNNHKQYLSITMPKGWTLWSALIDGNAVMPASSESSSEALIPLKKMSKTDEGTGFVLELVYWYEAKKMGLGGTISFETPVIDINCQKINGELWVPSRYQYKKFKGSIEKVKQYTSRYISSTVNNQRQSGSRRNLPMQSNTFAMGKKGRAMSLPVEIEVPKEGLPVRFSKKLTIAGEKGELSFSYRKHVLPLQKLIAFLIWLLTLLLAFLTGRWILENHKKQKTWPMIVISFGVLMIVVMVNIGFNLQAPALIRTALLGVFCAVLARLGQKKREEVVA